MNIHSEHSCQESFVPFCANLDLVSEPRRAPTLDSRTSSASATSEQVRRRTPENPTMLVNNQNKVTPLITTLNHVHREAREEHLLVMVVNGDACYQRPDMFIHENGEEKLNPAFEDWSTVD